MTNIPQSADLSEAKRLLNKGFFLVALHKYEKRPIGESWNKHFASEIDDSATGYGFPLVVNERCSIDPDHWEMAKAGVASWGFDLEELMQAGVRTVSTRPNSGGRSAFSADEYDTCRWLSFKVFDEYGRSTTVLELRAKSDNLQDVVPGIVYKGASGDLYSQQYANGRTLSDAPTLPDDFARLWRKLSTEDDALREYTKRFTDAIAAAGFTLGGRAPQYRPPMGNGESLAFPAPKIRGPFNERNSVEDVLTDHGYSKAKNGRWTYPGATGAPGIRPIPHKDGLWRSDHAGDPLHGTFDAWAAYVQLTHKGDLQAAIDAEKDMKPSTTPFDLSTFSLRGESREMEAKMLDDKFVLGRIAILGQSTTFFAKPNAGKTLLTLWLIKQAIETGEINGEDVYYINADDNHKGITQKLKMAERVGFHMLAPRYKGFKPPLLVDYLAQMIQQDSARGKVLFLDTVKKFTDIMDKKRGSDFNEAVRQFVAHGGTVIMLAHVNKHRDGEGKVIAAGTSDLVDDCDCAYTLDILDEDKRSGERTVRFENIKDRGDVAKEEIYRYNAGGGLSYADRLASVSRVSDKEGEEAQARRAANEKRKRNEVAIDAIKECLKAGTTLKTELIIQAAENSGESRKKIRNALREHTGKNIGLCQYWTVDVRDKNAHHYSLSPFC